MSDKIIYHQVVEMGTFDDSDIFISESGVPDATLDIAKDILEKFSGATFQFIAELDADVTPNFGAGTVFDTYEANTAYMLIDGSEKSEKNIESMLFWDVNNGIARRNWARNKGAINQIKRAMKKNSKLKVTLPNLVDDKLFENL